MNTVASKIRTPKQFYLLLFLFSSLVFLGDLFLIIFLYLLLFIFYSFLTNLEVQYIPELIKAYSMKIGKDDFEIPYE